MKLWFRRILNLSLYLVFCFLAGSGLLLEFRLPPGSRGGRGLSMLDMGRHDWGELHLYAGLLFLALIVVHIIMSWGWLKRVAANRQLWPIILGLLMGLGILGWFLTSPVDSDSGYRGENGRHYDER